jgi:hypothetical protein
VKDGVFSVFASVLLSGLLIAAAPALATPRIVHSLDPVTGDTVSVPVYRRTFAVVVGIDRYANLNDGQQLMYCVRDAYGMARLLRERYAFDTVITLFNEKASRANILKVLLEDVGSQCSSEDAVLFFFAGHGITIPTSRYGPMGCLVPHDGSLVASRSYLNISMEEIKNEISRQLAARHVFYIVDACYSGLMTTRSVTTQSSRSVEFLRELTREDARQVLTAGTDKQPVLDGGPRGHSVFTGRVIEKLESVEDYITASELSSWISERVFQDAAARGHTQRPVGGTLWGMGDFVFVPTSRIDSTTLAAVTQEAPVRQSPLIADPAPSRPATASVSAPATGATRPAAASAAPSRPRPQAARRLFIGTPDAVLSLELESPR